ncbi:MAG TPA: rhodanese-like domain-containing protein [Phycisphaerae bacterium]|nr:rhodanese-like domain-containing protein [Phycisphaerae bacterium]HNU44672.1 rhodanese-like domain-containing protein [Phycisphaerae bacterium]
MSLRGTLTTVVEVIVLLVVAGTLALGANALRPDSVRLGRNYFEKPVFPINPGYTHNPGRIPAGEGTSDPAAGLVGQAGEAGPEGDGGSEGTGSHSSAVEQLGLQSMTFDEALEMYHDDMYRTRHCIFVDARPDTLYREGHISGAFQLDPYHLEFYLPDLVDIALNAHRIVVYCTGGDCEDSLFAARDLMEAGVAADRIFVYEGGFDEWKKKGGPMATGGQ